jgi:DDE superfamily endonuclease
LSEFTITGDEVYGDSPRLRETIQAHGRFYVLAVSANTRVWTERPQVQEPQEQTGGRPRRARRLAEGAPSARMVSEVVASWPSRAWKRLAVVEGEKGPIEYDWARKPVVESRDQLPGPDVWLLARRSISDPKHLAYYLAYAPARTSFETLIWVASSRYTVEQCIEEAKGETGLDEYARALLAQLVPSHHLVDDGPCLARQHSKAGAGKKSVGTDELAELTVPEVRRLLAIALPLPMRSPELHLAWSLCAQKEAILGPSKPLPTTCAPTTSSSQVSCAFITTVVVLGVVWPG